MSAETSKAYVACDNKDYSEMFIVILDKDYCSVFSSDKGRARVTHSFLTKYTLQVTTKLDLESIKILFHRKELLVELLNFIKTNNLFDSCELKELEGEAVLFELLE